jgi:S1-C subfamily serine protease
MTLLYRAKSKIRELKNRLKAYFKRLLFPLHLFPLKLITYSLYYLLKFLIGLAFSLIKIFFECLFFPFKSLKNFLKSLFIVFLILYIPVSLFVMIDYLSSQYGYVGKFLCAYGSKDKVQNSVVRIVGGNSEGSGFFISPDQVITNFHVIDGEPSPKIIFPNGRFITPVKITADNEVDLALLYTENKYPEYVMPLPEEDLIVKDEPLLSTGYPLGTSLTEELPR